MVMRRNLLCPLVLLAIVAVCAGTALAAEEELWDRSKLEYPPLPEFDLPDVERIVLSNQMVLYLLEDDEFPVIRGRALIRVGSMLDPVDKVGLAEMTGTVLRTGGSETYPGDEIDRSLENIGASVEFGIGETNGSGSFWCLSENLDDVLPIFADLLRNPTFPEEKIELAKVSVRREIAGRNDEPMDILFRELPKIIWGGEHPYALHPEYATVEAITRDDLVGFHAEHFHPDRMYLTIVGDFSAKKMKDRIERLFAGWTTSGDPPPEQPPIPSIEPGGGLAYAEKEGMTNTWIAMGHIGLKADSPDYAAINVLTEILGGGFSSRLFNEVRTKRGLAYAAGSSSGTSVPRPGIFLAYAGTRSDSALVVLDLMRREVEKVTREPVTDEELQRAKDGILNSYVFQFASKPQIANRMAYLDFFGYPEDFTARYPEQVKQLTADDLLAAAQRHIHPEDLQMLVLGNEEDFADPLSSLGMEYESVDLTIPEPPGAEVAEATPEALAHGKELLHRAVEATGGTEAWSSIENMAMQTKLSVTMQGQTMPVTVESIWASDGDSYVSQKLPFGEMVMVFGEEGGWKKGMQGIEDLTPEELAELKKNQARELAHLFDGIESVEAQALGTQTFADTESEAVLLRGEPFETLTLFLDPGSGRPVGMRYRGKSMMGPVETTEILGDYRPIGPVQVPHSIEILHDGEPFATGQVEMVTINEGVDESKFVRP
ncbi:MAG: hypothetical protein GF346_05855 [Candidatus Eisenbacteria bacterium]|nr:hypothetical protein [Candidatus Latescibacterota bacterium]MBD3301953.1 hypothetical protein [Candidatus Eisenbacteria bacterium]